MRKLLFLIAILFATIAKSATITVGSPNGGEIWAGCTVHNITWSSSGTSGFFTVEYSTDGGTSWTSLATNLNANSYSWTVPNTTSTNCLVHVYDFNTPATIDQSNAVFTITAPLILTSPNGGEVWQVGGPTHNITWAASGTGTNLTLEYSINLGASWTIITTTAVASSGTYTWTIPNFPSTQCLVRIKDNANSCMTDVSDNLFTISPPTHVITVTTPNTALNWYVYQSYNITWTSAYVTANVMLEYSTDNGSSWITIIASTPNTGSYSWTIPNTPSNQCLVKASEVGLPATNDVSDVNFTISPPLITVTSPNTAVTWYVGNTNTITWTNTTLSGSNVKLDYSIDGGTSWLPIVASVANTNTYSWTVPNNPSTTCRVRVSDASTPTTFDISNVNFTIASPFISLTSPNGSEIWNGCSTQTITWTRAGTTNNAKIEYSLDGGATWTTIVASYNAGAGTSCSYTWGPPLPNTPSTNCLVRVTDVSIPTATDVSSAPFTISLNTAIIVNTPNGGEVWQVGGPAQNITWAASGTSANLTIQYSVDNGTTWTNITTTASASSGTYSWTIPNFPSTQCLIKIVDASNTCKFDVSNAVFTISPPTHVITVTAPNTALTYYVANTYNITWTSAYTTSPFVAIDYSTDNGATWINITASTNNTGSYPWTVPNTPSNQCLVRVSEYGTPSVFDISNVNFTIAPAFITVTAPNTGLENWNGCSTQTITWTRGGTTNNAKIEYSLNGGTSWSTIVASYNAGAGTSCSYTWTGVPNTPSNNCLIRVTDVLLPAATDVSNTPFTISQNTAIIVTSPNGGEVWQVGGPTQNITWAASGTSANLTLEYSVNNGASWISITTVSASAGTYTWTIPNNPSTTCLIRLTDPSNTCKFDISDGVFTISPPTHVITVTAPNTALTYYVANTYNITWTSAYTSSPFVAIDYSTDNGATWISITTSTNNTGSYSWTVPNTPSNQCLVKVSEYGIPSVFDVSNVNFTIAPIFLTVTSPNTGAENWNGCSSQTITWVRGGTVNNAKIEYSINGGTSWITLNASYNAGAGTSCSYTWTNIPNTPSNNCLVRVTDVSLPTVTDVSNAPFTISQNTSIIVTSPNGGESWQVGGPTHTITWAASGTSATLALEYSINNGASWISITNVSASAGTYTWTIPNNPSTTCLVRLYDLSNSCKMDQSDAVFTIAPPTHVITVTAPNTALTWYVYQSYNITWTSSYVTGNVMLEYSTNNGGSWNTIIASTANTGSYSWTIPNTPSNQCLVRVSEVGLPATNDVSDVNFTISPPVITVTSPNTAVTWYVGNTNTVTWTNTTLSGPNVKIEYSIDAGASWLPVVASVANTGTYNWVIPNTPSTTCLVKVSDATTPTTFDVSNVNFTIASPWILVGSPNGGEVLNGCSVPTITWTKAGTTNNVRIEYSLNGGTSWVTIVSSTTNSGSYAWNVVPNSPSTNCLIRITDVIVPATTDVSNAPFTISQNTSIVLNTPNGGEIWQVGGPTHAITWAASGTSTNLALEYSIDNGVNWISITTVSASAGTYNWTIPNNPSTNCLVRLIDPSNSCKFDISDAVFTIQAPTPVITVTAPNTAVTWYVGTGYTINWTSAYLSSSFVAISYSTDNGITWNNIVASTNNTGSYSWTAINPPSTQCLVKVSEYGNPSVFDISNVTFTIASPSITVTAPNGGETYNGCSTPTITWSKAGTTNNVKIEYSLNGGTSWSIITSSTANTGTYVWNVVPNTASSNCLIRITDVITAATTDISNAPFTITPNTSIIITSPNGGEVWQVGGPTHNITWAASGTSATLTLEYSTNNGTSWISITNVTASAGTYTWTIPNTPSTTCLVRLYDASNSCKMDQSDAVFTISPATPYITVTSPNTAVTWYVGSTYTITWTSAYLSSTFVKIDYSVDNGATWISITSATNNTGSYNWTAINPPSSTCLVKVTDYGSASTYDISNVNFTISPPVTITAPNGGEVVNSCTSSSITWVAGGCSGSYKIEISTNGGSTWSTLSASYAAAGTGSCSYAWSISNTPSANCLVRVSDVSAPAKIDQSNATFTIAPAISVTQPNVGGVFTVGSVLNINWTSTGVSNFYNIDYSIDNGATWISIVFNANITTNTYAWTIPNNPSTNCLVRVIDNVNTCKRDQSDVVFTISSTVPAITVTAPNGGENWSSCSTQNITWNASGTSGSYNIDYSINGGTTWTSIITSYAAAGSPCSYSWTVPNVISSNCVIKVTDAVVTTRVDQSNAAFIISPGVVVTASGTTTICNGASAGLSASGATNYSWLPVTGLSNAAISNPVATPTTTTTYTVTGTTGGCSNTATVTITVNPVPNVTATPAAISICAGASTSVIANGATSYSWSPSAGLSNASIYNPVANPASTTTYTVTGTSAGCSNTATSVITVNPVPTVTVTGTSPICAGTSTGLNASGAATYSWSPATGLSNPTVANPTATPAGTITYTVTGTSSGCSATAPFTVNVLPAPTITVTGGGNICAGASASLSASGATTYSWSPATGLSNASIANPVATPSSTTTYTVTGTSGSCSNTAIVTVSVIPAPVVTVSGGTNICNGTSTALTASGATTYSWLPATGLSSTVIANPNAYPSTTTTYTVTGTTSSCTGTETVTITVNPAPVISITGGGTICAGSSTALNASGAISYSWLPATGLSSTTISNPVATPSATTTYTVTGTGAGCSSTATVTVTVINIPVVTVSGTTTICDGTTTNLTASGAASYSWSPATGLSSATISNPVASPSATTTYTITGTTSGCSGTTTKTITVNPIPVVTVSPDVTICNGTTTTLTASGATTYSWSPATALSSSSISNPVCSSTITRTYTVTGTSSGCSATAAVTVTVTPLPTVSASGAATICAGASTVITASGTSTSYNWLPSASLSNPTIANPAATPAATTTYTVTGTANGCSNTASVTVTITPLPVVNVSGASTICIGTSTVLSASGATSYVWSPATGLSSATVANPTANPTTTTTYTVSGTTGSCTGTTTFTLNAVPAPVVSVTGSATICSGTSTPLNASGATTYSWSPAAGLSATNIANPTANPASTTTYVVTGSSGTCTDTAQVLITVISSPVVSVSGTTTICSGSSTTLTASGAASYSWSPGTGLSNSAISNPVANPASTTTYTVTGTTGSCTGTTTVTVTVNPVPTVTASGSTTICSGQSVSITSSGATSYAWLPATGLSNASIANPVATPAASTTYTVTGSALGCSATATVSITVNPTPTANAGSPASICLGNSTTLNASGGTTYSWLPVTGLSNPAIANPVATPTSTTTYTVTVGNGSCSSTSSVTITVNSLSAISAGSNVTIGCGGTATLNATGGTSYSWSPATGLSSTTIANPVATPAATTTYTVTATTGGCSGTATVTVTVTGMTADAGSYTQICAGSNTTLNGTIGGSSPALAWLSAQRFGQTSFDNGNDIAVDASGNRYITGSFNGTISFGSFSLTSSGYDAYIAKISPAGTVLWAQKGGGTSTDEAWGVAVDASGNVYVTGNFYSTTATFGSVTLTNTGSATGDIFIAKYNSAGTIQWAVKAGSTATDDAGKITCDASGAWISGRFTGTAAFGSFNLTTAGGGTDMDMYVAKYNTSGTCQWAQRGGGTTSSDKGMDIAVDGSGNSYVTGYFTGTGTFGSFTINAIGGASDYDAFVAKYNSTGTIQWVKQGGIASYGEIARSIAVDASGNSYMILGFQSTTTFGAVSLTSNGANDLGIVKYNSAGTEQWGRSFGGTSSEGASSVCIDPSTGNIMIAASSVGGSITIGSTTLTSFGSSGQLFVAVLTPANAIVSAIKSNSPSPAGDGANGIAADLSGNAYLCGTFGAGGASPTAVFGSTTLTTSGSTEIYEAKLGITAAGTYAWSPATGLSATNIANPVATPVSTTTYTLTVSNGSCTASDTVTIAVLPAPTANAGSPVTICSGTSTTLNASGGITYSWSPSTGLSAVNIASPVATPAATTTYTVTVGNGGTCTGTATVTVTVTPSPVANAGSDVSIACGASTTLNASGGTTYSWSPATGLSNPNVANPVATPPYSITYTVTATTGSCTSTDAVVVTVGSMTANAGPDVTICSGNSTPLSGSSTGGGGSWVSLASSPVFTQSVGTYTPITGGTVWLNTSSPSMDDVISPAITIPTFKFNNINYTSLYISTNGFITFGTTLPATTTYLPISATTAYAGAISAFGTDMDMATSGTPEIRYQTIGSEFVIQWKDMGRYSGTGTSDRLSFQIRLNTSTNQINIVYGATSLLGSTTAYPQIGLRGPNNTFSTNVNNRSVISSTGPWVNSVAGTTNTSSCYYNNLTPGTIPASGTTFTWSIPGPTTYSWAPPTGLSSTTIANPVATPTVTTTYTLTATSGGCAAVDMVTVTVVSPTSVSAGPDATICAGGNTALAATGGGTYSWSPSTGLSATNIANPVASPGSTTTYTVTVSSGSCSFTDAVLVTVNPLPAQPTAITGSNNVCSGSTNTYSISPVSGATSYTWTLPGGWTGTSSTTSITTTAGTTGGTISVVANNSCGSGTAQTLAVNITNIPAQPLAVTGSTSVCQGTVNAFSVAAVSGATSYTWTLPGGWTGTSTTNSISATSGAAGGTISVTANNTCGSSTAQTLAVAVNTVAAQPGAITGATTMCSGTAQVYSIAAVSGATSYTWTMPGGWTGTSTTTLINATAGTSGNITVTADNTCGSSTPQTMAVVVNTIPSGPASISGSTTICSGSTNTYSITSVSGAASYNWTLPGGWTGTSTTNSINATADANGGTISVTAGNTCGTSPAQTLNVTINPVPSQPAIISGNTSACSGSANTYSVTSVSGATSYTWTLPGGWTGSSATNSITVLAGTSGGTLSVTADNVCGSSSPQTLAVNTITAPSQPAAISGATAICEGTSQVYSIATVPGATGYTWTLPSDWTGTSATENITTTVGTMSGTISVTADNACGSSSPQSVSTVVSPLPGMPSAISGSSLICESTSQTYSITPVSGATSYTWTLPGTWTGTSSTETITANTDFNGGNVLVFASNGCGNGPTQLLGITVQTAPQQPVLSSADTVLCDGSSANYQVLFDVNANSYSWTLPVNWTGSSTSATMMAMAITNGGTLSVVENNTCGTSIPLNITVVVNPLPAVSLSSLGIVCDNDAAFTLTGGSPSGGSYTGTGVSGGNTFTPATSGAGVFMITYTYSDANSCSNNDTASIQVDLCTGVAATEETTDVKIYPNPFIEYTIVSIGKAIELNGTEIRVFDILGKEVMKISNIHSYEIRIDRDDLRDGMYFYKLINNGHEINTGKLIIE
jgi:hypothetical protein